MESALNEFLTVSVFAFILTFARIGTAMMLMPGTGDSFVSPKVRLHLAAAISLMLFPLALPYVPDPLPDTVGLFMLIAMEFTIGMFFGAIARTLIAALDTAGMAISLSSGLANGQLFNPTIASQGSIMGAFISVTGVVLIFATDMHHLLFMGIMESYELFPLGSLPEIGSMADLMARVVSTSFAVGIKFAAPFIVFTILVYASMGVLARVMPQIQVLILALPLQILVSVTLLMIVMSTGMFYWLGQFEQGMVFFLSVAK